MDNREDKRAAFERAFATMPDEVQRQVLTEVAVYIMRLGVELPESVREGLRESGLPIASVYQN